MGNVDNDITTGLLRASKVAIVTLILLLAGAAFLYPLRMSFIDAPFMIFQIMKKGAPDIMVQRYGSIVTQIFPFLAYKIGLPMKAIMLLYSVSFNLFYLVTAIILFRLKEYDFVIILALYQIVFVTDTFFWTNNEIHQGTAWLLLTTGLWQYYEKHQIVQPISLTGLLLMMLISVFTHPLVIPVLVYIMFYFLLDGRLNLKNTRHRLITVSCLLICMLKLLVSSNNWYDGGKFNQLSSHSIDEWLLFFNKPVFKAFFTELFSEHIVVSFIMILSLVGLLYERKYIMAVLMVTFTFIYLVFTAMLFPDFIRFYIESQWMPVSVFFTLPMLQSKILFKHSAILSYLIAGFFIFWIAGMGRPYHLFEKRYALQQTILQKMEEKQITKAIITDTGEDVNQTFILPWGLPVESLLLSSIQTDKPARTFLINQAEKRTDDPAVFLSSFESIPIKSLNQAYFRLDTTDTYTVISMQELMK